MNVLEYTAYGLTNIPNESMLKKLIGNIKKTFHKNAENKIGVRYKVLSVEGGYKAMMVTYFPKLKEERKVYEEIYREQMTKMVHAEAHKMDVEVFCYGRLPFIEVGRNKLPHKLHESKHHRETERYVIEKSNDLYNRFCARCARMIEKAFRRNDSLEEVIVDCVFDEVVMYAMFPDNVAQSILNNVDHVNSEVDKKWLEDRKKEVDSRVVKYEINHIYTSTKRGIEESIMNAFNRREGTIKVVVEIDRNFLAEAIAIKSHLEMDFYKRIRNIKEVKHNKNVITYEVEVVHPYTAHRTDNVRAIFNDYAIEFVEGKIEETIIEFQEMDDKPKCKGPVIDMNDVTVRLKYKRFRKG